VLWRSPQSIQLELGADAVIVEGIDSATVAALTGPGYVHDTRAASARPGTEQALDSLLAAGYLWQQRDDRPAIPGVHLAAELAALRVRHGSTGDDILHARAAAKVVVHGTGRLAVAIATTLAAANVGHIQIHDSGDVHRHDSAPGGLLPSDEGRRFNEAATDAVRRAAPGVGTGPLPFGTRADLAVLACDQPVEEALRDQLHIDRIPHLAARSEADLALVGPLVLPGLTSCLRCADLARTDRDDAWSALAVQLYTPVRYAPPAELALTTFTAGLLAVQALAFLDADEPATLSATLELRLPHWRLRRRGWPAHPDCDCGAHLAGTRPAQWRP
jgi:hypothetical protein